MTHATARQPPADSTEHSWKAWRHVIAPLPSADEPRSPWVDVKILTAGHNIAVRAWHLRRPERTRYAAHCAASGRQPERHAPLDIHLPGRFDGVCFTLPLGEPIRHVHPQAIAFAAVHQRQAAATTTGEGAAR